MARSLKDWIKAVGLTPKNKLTPTGRERILAMYEADEAPTEEEKKKAEEDADKINAEEDEEEEDDEEKKPVIAHRNNLKAFGRQLRAAFQIEAACKDHPEIGAQVFDDNGDIRAGWDLKRVQDAIDLKTLRASRESGPFIAVGGRDRTHTQQALEAAMLIRAGGRLDHKSYQGQGGLFVGLPQWLRAGINDEAKQRAIEHAHVLASMSAVDLCKEALRIEGRQIPVNRSEMIRAAISGGTLSNIFTTSVNAQIISSYEEAPDTYSAWTQATDVPDFKVQDEIQLVKDGATMKKLPPGGTAEHGKRSDRIESYRIARYAEQISVDDQDVINDNLGAIKDFPVEMGKKAKRLVGDLVYAILLANPTLGATGLALFSDSNSPDNLFASTALSGPNLKAAISAMLLVQDNGVTLNLEPTHLIVPPTLKWTAMELLNSTAVIIAGTAGSVTERGNANLLANALTPVVEPRLENGVTISTGAEATTTYSGSASDWFVASTMARTIKIAYLQGTGRAPQTRNGKFDQGRFGMWWDIVHDVGAAAMDFRGLQKHSA